jgi:glycosyltransferase involved in cell wall biosynthesis
MLLEWPKVSVIISTYKRPEMLKRALQSCLAQTYKDFEVLVVDDGSDTAGEPCRELLPEFEAAGIRLVPMNLQENSGYQCTPKNVGISYARGSFIAYLDDDNEYDPWHLQTLVDEIDKMGCDAVFGRWRNCGDGPVSGDSEFISMNRASALGLLQTPMANFIDTSSMLHSKAAFVAVFGEAVWNPEVRRFGDWELVARSLSAGVRWRGVDKVTFTYWWHGENLQITRPPNEDAIKAAK